MNNGTILITYASRFGSTQEVAEAVSAVLREAGLEVELQPMQEVKQLEQYEAVVLGAAIYNAHWHPEALRFVAQHQTALSRQPVAIFTLGPLSPSQTAKLRSRRQLDQELKQYPWLKPVALEVFAGKYDPSKPGMGFFERLLPARDYRDWQAIRSWAGALAAQLQQAGRLIPA